MRRRSAFTALSLAIVRGFLRDRASVFFAIVFPLMFLVLFGGLFADQSQSKVDMLQVGDVSFIDEMPAGEKAAFAETFDITRTDDLDAAIAEVKKGDADVAVEMQGDTLVAHYTQTDQVKAAVTQGVLQAFVDSTNVALSGRPPTYRLEAERVEDDSLKTIQYVTPGLLGWAVAMSASFGAAATLNGWRNSKLLRRLQLSPVSTNTLVGARVSVTVGVALTQMAIFLGLGLAAFGLRLTGAWPQRGDARRDGPRRAGLRRAAADGVPQRLVLPARRRTRMAPGGGARPPPLVAQPGDARRDGPRRAGLRRAAADPRAGGLRRRRHRHLRQAVPLGDHLMCDEERPDSAAARGEPVG